MYTTGPCGYKTPKFEMKKASCNGSEYKPLKKSPFKKKGAEAYFGFGILRYDISY